MRSTVSVLENGQPGPVHFRAYTLYLPGTGFLKSWATDDQGNPLYAMEAKVPRLPLVVSLLFEPNAGQVEELLKEKGIPIVTETDLSTLPDDHARQSIEKTVLTRWNNDLAWVIGTDSPKLKGTTPELWIEKDTFLPLRLIANFQSPAGTHSEGAPLASETTALDDFHFDNYRYFHEFPYPRQITYFKGMSSQPVFREDVNDVLVDASFDSNRVRVSENGFTSAGNSAIGPLHDLIQSYYTAAR